MEMFGTHLFFFILFSRTRRHWGPLHVNFIPFKSSFGQKKKQAITRPF